jgi:cellulose synthase/poly-beta-1,6-N-acetylglucosamine synthase-like glycosyltransferase
MGYSSMLHVAIPMLAIAITVLIAPLFLDLTLALVGNLVRRPAAHGATGNSIRLAVIVPAHDEEQMIARMIASLLAADHATPVFVVAHNCSDCTAAEAAKAGARVLELANTSLRGKGAALRHGFQAAAAEGVNAFLIVDADSVVSANAIAATRAALEQGAPATQCRYELELPSTGPVRPMARLRVLAFRGMNVLRARGRAALGFSCGLFGNGFALTAETLARVPFTADSIAEDLEYHTKLACEGMRVRWVEEASVYAPLSHPGKARAHQEARWSGGRFSVARLTTFRLLAAILRGRFRACETLAEVWSIPLSLGILSLIVAATLPVYWLREYAAVCAVITLLYVIEAALIGNDPVRDLNALAVAPLYLAWKAAITPLVLIQSRRHAAWVRTKREVPKP